MCELLLSIVISATIPSGWPMLRCNQERTGYTPGYAAMVDTAYKKWGFVVEDSENDIIYSSPVAADFTGDGKKDLCIGASYSGGYPIANLYRGYDRYNLWDAGFTGYGPKFNTPALMEVTGDGVPEVFLHDNTSGDFRCLFGTNGTGKWVNTQVGAGYFSSPLVIEGSPGAVIVGDDVGLLWSINAETGATNYAYGLGGAIQPPSYGDVTGDGTKEVVVTSGTSLCTFSTAGTFALLWSMNMGDNATTPALANMDGDAALEIIVYNYGTGKVRGFNYGSATPFLDVSVGAFTADFTPGGTVCDYWPPSPAIGEVTDDAVLDIFIHNGKTLYCINGATKTVQWSKTTNHLFGSPVLADLDNDGELEIVVTGQPPDPAYRIKIEFFEHTGAVKFQYWELITAGGYPDPVTNEACLVDVDGDGRLEVAAVDFSCYFVCLDLEPEGAEESQGEQDQIRLLNSLFTDVIKLSLPKTEWVEYRMHDIAGRTVYEGKKTLVQKGVLSLAPKVATGVYFFTLKIPKEQRTFKVVKAM